MPLKRLPKWDTGLLPTYLAACKDKPFAWGEHDCCLFAANACQAITGVDIAASFRGKYTDKASAFVLIKSVTGGTTVGDAAAFCAEQFGLAEYEHPRMAQRGDLVVTANGNTTIAGVVHTDGRHIAAVGEGGLLYLPISGVQRAWRI